MRLFGFGLHLSHWTRLGLAAVLLLALLSTGPAHANAAECRALTAQLASLSFGGDNAIRQYRRFDSALRQQYTELRKTEQMARRANCRRNQDATCQSLVSTIAKMKANVRKLTATRNRYAKPLNAETRRSQIQSRLRALRCDRRQTVISTQANVPAATAAIRRQSATGNTGRVAATLSPQAENVAGLAIPQTSSPGTLASGHRIMCVRLCDGYFFPIGFDTNDPDLEKGQLACEAQCPGADMRVFSHVMPDEETEDMRDALGNLYTMLDTAFAFRKPGHMSARDSSCSCDRAPSHTNKVAQTPVPTGLLQTKTLDDQTLVVLPSLRPDLFADPETQTNQATGLDAQAIALMTSEVLSEDGASLIRNDVRVVLPEFLPDPAMAIELQSLDPISGL